MEQKPVQRDVILKKDSVLSLMRDLGGKGVAKTVYLTKSSDNKLVIIRNLEFTLWLAIPPQLDPNLLYLELLKSYHNEQCGERRMERLREEISELEKDVIQLESTHKEKRLELLSLIKEEKEIPEKYQILYENYQNNGEEAFKQWRDLVEKKKLLSSTKREELSVMERESQSLKQFSELMKMSRYDDLLIHDSSKRVKCIKERMKSNKDFFVILKMSSFTLPANAALKKRLGHATLWRLKFDNHHVQRFFLSKLRNPIKIWQVEEVEDREGEEGKKYKSEQQEYPILILTDGGENASIYNPRENQHDGYIMKQTFQFLHQEHSYQWSLSNYKESNTEGLRFYPFNTQQSLSTITTFSTMEQLTRGLFQKRLGTFLIMNQFHFQFPLQEVLFVDGQYCQESVVQLDTVKPIQKIAKVDGKIKVSKPLLPLVNRNSTKKRSIYSLTRSETTQKALKQQSLFNHLQ